MIRPVLDLQREGIGTQWWIQATGEALDGVALKSQLNEAIDQFDRDYSRFRRDSWVGQLNRAGQVAGFPPELYDMMAYGEHLREVSAGAFNLGVGRQLEDLGYDAQYSFRVRAERVPLTGSVITELERGYIVLRPGAVIDLGGIGKGWLIDRLSEALVAAGASSYMVNGGGDVRVLAPQAGWRLALEYPVETDMAIGEVVLTDGAVAASGPAKRAWDDAQTGRRYHHLVQPETGESYAGPLAVFTSARTATVADAASTILYLTPGERVEDLARQLKVEYLIIYEGGRAVRSAGYPGELY